MGADQIATLMGEARTAQASGDWATVVSKCELALMHLAEHPQRSTLAGGGGGSEMTVQWDAKAIQAILDYAQRKVDEAAATALETGGWGLQQIRYRGVDD